MVTDIIEDSKEVKEEKQIEKPNLQDFMNDMDTIGKQLQDKSLKKTMFNFADQGVTNYLLWLMLGELMTLNEKL